MKRDRNNDQIIESFDSSSKKIHYPIESKSSKERIYRCTQEGCQFIACTPNNVVDHIKKKHADVNKN